MIYVLVPIYVIVCVFLILVVLLQQGKGADVSAAFGASSSQTTFGARGATTLLEKDHDVVLRGVLGPRGHDLADPGAAARLRARQVGEGGRAREGRRPGRPGARAALRRPLRPGDGPAAAPAAPATK